MRIIRNRGQRPDLKSKFIVEMFDDEIGCCVYGKVTPGVLFHMIAR